MHAGGRSPRFAWAKLGKKRPLYSDEFEIYLVQVKSDSPAGRALHVDPIAFFEKNIKEMGLRKRVRHSRDGAPGQCGTLREPEAPQRAVDDVPGLDQRARYSVQVRPGHGQP